MGAEQETALQQNWIIVDENKPDGKKMESVPVTEKSPKMPQEEETVEELKPREQQPKSIASAAEAVEPAAAAEGKFSSITITATPGEQQSAEESRTRSEQAAAPIALEQGEKGKNGEEEGNAEATKSASNLPLPMPVTEAEKEAPSAAAEKTKEEEVKGKPAEEEKEKESLSNINTLLLNDDEVATTLAAASKKLASAHARETKKHKSGLSKFLSALSPKRILIRFRDCYVNTCMMASEKGDFANLVAGHPGMFYASDNVMSRTSSQKRERDHEEALASLSRQVSASLSRQASQANTRGSSPSFNRTTSTGISGLKRNASTGIPGLNRNASSGISGLNRSGSTGLPSLSRQASTGINGGAFGRNSSTRRHVPDSELYKAGRGTFLESLAAKNSAPTGNAAVKSAYSAPSSLPSSQQKKSQ